MLQNAWVAVGDRGDWQTWLETPITTGMSVTAEIKVGKRRVIEFFIYPLIKYLDEGISVR